MNTITLGRFDPLSAGQHSLDMYWQFSAMHCDGLDRVISWDISITNCLQPGETQYWYAPDITFDVVPASQAT